MLFCNHTSPKERKMFCMLFFRQVLIVIRIGNESLPLSQLSDIRPFSTNHQLVVFVQTNLKNVSFLYNNIISFCPLFWGERSKTSPKPQSVSIDVVIRKKISNMKAISAVELELIPGTDLFFLPFDLLLIFY